MLLYSHIKILTNQSVIYSSPGTGCLVSFSVGSGNMAYADCEAWEEGRRDAVPLNHSQSKQGGEP
jgi:hypothetical protein